MAPIADREQHQRQQVEPEEQRRQVVSRQPRDRGDGLVHERQARLRVDERACRAETGSDRAAA